MHSSFRAMIAVVGYCLIGSSSAFASDLYKNEQTEDAVTITSGLSIGVMNGEANEYVYNPANGDDISQLIWTYDNVVVLNGGLSASWNAFVIGGNIRTSLTDDSTMDDYDFDGTVCGLPADVDCHSYHEDTLLKNSLMVDLYAGYDFYKTQNISVTALAGYKWDYNKFEAYDGVANYAVLPPGLGITYEQWWEAPYIGLQIAGQWDRWSLSGKVTGSWWVDSHDEDNHHWRSLRFTEDFDTSEMVAVTVGAGYQISENLSTTLSYSYEDWSLAKGSTTITDTTTGASTYIPGDAAGADNTKHIVSFGLNYKF